MASRTAYAPRGSARDLTRGLAGGDRDAVMIRLVHAYRCELLFEQVPEQAVADAAAAEQNAAQPAFRRQEALQGTDDAPGDKVRCRTQQVVQGPLILPGQL